MSETFLETSTKRKSKAELCGGIILILIGIKILLDGLGIL